MHRKIPLPCLVRRQNRKATSTKKEETQAEKDAKREKAKKKALKRKSKYPVSGSVSTGYSANHANFVESGGDFGTQILSVNGGVSYRPLC